MNLLIEFSNRFRVSAIEPCYAKAVPSRKGGQLEKNRINKTCTIFSLEVYS